ncbi:TFIIH complex serine/threonine-protein kinase subunit kin28 [Orbilia oligospora]|uniref:TFIIH complex serine/threonine-protein kinase subunit kin28 n=1 Tax=Orbilia oligospora TaxID=2813651 RepID=A0A7C8NJ33_ORBOL|nr:TFIIH complex serine/threonine-protein kinase subunit kin28 [Orbilia oligospora]KAF3124927.1 TFIIH complex serine/threonine-protein kinase subunit kin28 [Orbilia oligospora]
MSATTGPPTSGTLSNATVIRRTLPFGNGNGNNTPLSSMAAESSGDVKLPNDDSDVSDNDDPDDLNTRTKKKYTKDRKLGEGAYAVVNLGHRRATATEPAVPVAIKKIKVNTEFRDGITMDAIREVKYLRELHHINIIALLDVFSSKNQNLCLVLEFLDSDLEMIIRDTSQTLSMGDIKSWMLMSLRGLWWCHKSFVIHRDIKPNNLLLAANGVLKLADFGLARSFADPKRHMTHQVITRWYRPPELFYGAKFYSSSVDIFSLGLVFCELMLRVPFLAGNTDLHQLELICQWLGTPTEENWPGVTTLPGYHEASGTLVKERGTDFFMNTFIAAGESGVDLLMKMLRLDPRKRCSAREALDSKWFSQEPYPTPPANLPKKGGGKGIEKVGSDLKRKAGELFNTPDERGKKLKHITQEQKHTVQQKDYTSSSSQSSDYDEDTIDRGWWIGEKPVISRKKKRALAVAQIPDGKENDATAGMEDCEMRDNDNEETEVGEDGGEDEDEEMGYTDDETKYEDNEEMESKAGKFGSSSCAGPKDIDETQDNRKTNPDGGNDGGDEDDEAKEIRELLNDLFTDRTGERMPNPLRSERVRNLIRGHPYEKHFKGLIRLYYSNPDSNPNYIR